MHLTALRRFACSLAIGLAAAGIATAAPAAAVSPKLCTAADVTITGDLSSGTITAVTKSGHADCLLSLNSYATHGSTWSTTGTQTFVGHDSGLVTSSGLTLKVTVPAGFCQIDLYGSATAYDGHDGPIPHYPNVVVPTGLLADFNGRCSPTSTESGTPTVTPTETVTPTVTATETVTPTETGSVSATDTSTASPTSPGASVFGQNFNSSGTTTVTPSVSPSVLGIIFTKKPPLSAPKVKPPVATLPFTGIPLVPALTFGFGLVLAGALLLGSTRRHRLHRMEL